MSRHRFGTSLCLSLLLSVSVSTVQAATLHVHCGGSVGLTSIGAALKALQYSEDQGPSTINVSGACHENIVIQNMDGLTLNAVQRASITDVSGGALDVVDIRNSRVTISGMTIDGQNGVVNDALDCEQGSQCRLIGNTIRGDVFAVGVYALSSALIVGGSLQNGTSAGLFAFGDVVAVGVLIQGNPVGLVVRFGGRARIGVVDPVAFPGFAKAPTTIEGNATGVQVRQAQFACAGCVIQGNSGDGINADLSTEVRVGPGFFTDGSSVAPSVTGNTGHGVYLGDLSSGSFAGPLSAVSGNGQPDIVCNSPTSVSRGALDAAGGAAHTNCAN